MEHILFKPKSFVDAQNQVVGDCNGISMEERWRVETPLFADQIIKYSSSRNPPSDTIHILDYGCGVGRLAKEILSKLNSCTLYGLDASQDMLVQATKYVNQPNFHTSLPQNLPQDIRFDTVYCVYVLQHAPSIELREILQRIHYHLKDDGYFIYCSSDYRMAVRFDNGGFFDDRFLGVNLREEIGRLFDVVEPLFPDIVLNANPILKTMIKGGLEHPAFIYKKKKIQTTYFDTPPVNIVEKSYFDTSLESIRKVNKLVLINRLAPGDILVMTNAIRDLQKAYPDTYQIAVRTPCNEIFDNNPYVTTFSYDEDLYCRINNYFQKGDGKTYNQHVAVLGDIGFIDMQYPMIHSSGASGRHFAEGHRGWLEDILGITIPQTFIHSELYLSEDEKNWVSPIVVHGNYEGKYWLINAGSKGDYTLKQYPYYQEVVNLLKDKIKFVQIGSLGHNHKSLDGVISMVGKTQRLREFFRIVYKAEGLITCVSLPMHVADAFKKPCVVVAGAREGTRWELYPSHQFLYVNGCLPCATYDGCWRSKFQDCTNKVGETPRCMTLIKPEDVVRSVLRYYEGGILV
jgi:ADP-heptose:LPS heptosyltransferase/SAM-dependent methyltransferase